MMWEHPHSGSHFTSQQHLSFLSLCLMHCFLHHIQNNYLHLWNATESDLETALANCPFSGPQTTDSHTSDHAHNSANSPIADQAEQQDHSKKSLASKPYSTLAAYYRSTHRLTIQKGVISLRHIRRKKQHLIASSWLPVRTSRSAAQPSILLQFTMVHWPVSAAHLSSTSSLTANQINRHKPLHHTATCCPVPYHANLAPVLSALSSMITGLASNQCTSI
jgi:hypothetical protein